MSNIDNLKVIKKDGSLEKFDPEKIVMAITLSAQRVMVQVSPEQFDSMISQILDNIEELELIEIPIIQMHQFVECALDSYNPAVAKSYREYRNYKIDFVEMMNRVYERSQAIKYIGDRENSNTDSALVATQRSLIYNELNKRLYRKFFMTPEERQACRDGYIYVHDQSARLDAINCCLFNAEKVMRGGFEMGNIFYNEPKTLDVAFDVLSDVVLSTASQQYGGFTVPEVDKLMAYYARKSYDIYVEEFKHLSSSITDVVDARPIDIPTIGKLDKAAHAYALEKVKREYEQGWQGIEMKFNTVGSSRGDYPFTTMTFGLATDLFGRMATETILNVHMKGQGAPGHRRPVLFPKLVFLYDGNLHDGDGVNSDLWDLAVKCSAVAMYPDHLSLTGKGYVASIYKKYGKPISPMGCRAFLSPWFERGGIEPADENDQPVFVGRFNIGAVSLHLPMILAKSREENKDFYEVLDYYLELIRGLHQRTYEYLGNIRASTNPIMFCEGGALGGNLKPTDKIAPLLKPMTASFGVTALNELQQLYNEKSLVEDGQFALEVMEYINNKLTQFKKADGHLYACYGTPAENLCSLQIEQFRKKYGVVKNVSDRGYVSNSFHCHVSEDISPIQKQDLENRFWDYFNGGKIQYVKYPISYNIPAVKTLIKRAMDEGFYEGVNLSLAYCAECGYQQLEMDTCPKCGTKDVVKIDRMNGYLSYSRIHGHTRLNDGKMEEIKDRVSM